MLGHLVDMDNLARDLIQNRYAYLSDARLDMSNITVPVLWIYGSFDHWLESEEVRDIMSVQAAPRELATQGVVTQGVVITEAAPREIVEIPTGHNLRSSDDAIRAFEIITASIYKNLFGESLDPVGPDREEMLRLITYERERIEKAEPINLEQYWQNYLIGNAGKSAGYDFYRNLKDFRTFLSLQCELIDPADQEFIADFGCGTGLLLENLLQHQASLSRPARGLSITAADLVQAALDKTRIKCEQLVEANPCLESYRFDYLAMNLDPNRLIPVQRFIHHPELDFNTLRNRIEGLSNATLDRLLTRATPALYRFMRGAAPTEHVLKQVHALLEESDLQAVLDFNRAARFLKKRLTEMDLRPAERRGRKGLIAAEDHARIRTTDIFFETIDFGDNDLKLTLPFDEASFHKIVASLFISYLYNPEDIMQELYRLVKPGGTVLVSSMKLDSDISGIFTEYVDQVHTKGSSHDLALSGARAMLNEAASLFELEEDGYFRFYSDEELLVLFKDSGFGEIRVYRSMGSPPQAVIVTGKKN